MGRCVHRPRALRDGGAGDDDRRHRAALATSLKREAKSLRRSPSQHPLLILLMDLPHSVHAAPAAYVHGPQALITASKSALFTAPSPVTSPATVPGVPVAPQLLMTARRSAVFTNPSPPGDPAGAMSSEQLAGGVIVIV